MINAARNIMWKMHLGIEDTSDHWDLQTAVIAACLHDIGRFPQVTTTGTFSEVSQPYNHATQGVSILHYWTLTNPLFPLLQQSNIDIGVNSPHARDISQAILSHSAKEYRGNNPYVLLTRDADKLANLRHIFAISQIDNVDFSQPSQISEECLSEVLQGNMMANEAVKTSADKILRYFAWMFDINFAATRKLILEDKIPQAFYGYFKILGTDEADILAIMNILVENWNGKSKDRKFTVVEFLPEENDLFRDT